MRPGHRGGPRDRHAVAEVALCYTGDLLDPEERALHPRLLPAAGRADRRRRRARPGDQGHGRPAAAAGRRDSWSPRCGSASTCPCTCTPTTPPAASSRRCSPRSTPAWTRSTWRAAPMAGTTSQPPASALVAALAHTERATSLRPARGDGPGAVLGGGAQGLRAVRVGPARPDRAGLRPRDPGRAAVQPAAAGDRARAWARSSSRSRRCTPRPTGSSAGR